MCPVHLKTITGTLGSGKKNTAIPTTDLRPRHNLPPGEKGSRQTPTSPNRLHRCRDSNDRRSTSGWVFRFNNSPVSLASKKQGLVTRSSMESEVIAGSFASIEGIWLIRLSRDFRHNFIPIPLFTDNQPVILYSQNDLSNTHTKHIATHYHYTCDQVTSGNIKSHYISTHENVTNILIKSLSPHKHVQLLEALRVKHV